QVSLESLINIAISRGIASRHVAVLRAVANGDTAAVIAKQYGIAERTARAWRAMAISELRERTQCVA
ncbi:MAG: LuxR C-terminal-related transcriptional regulator, partial [Acidimicrobiaceae bacterium]